MNVYFFDHGGYDPTSDNPISFAALFKQQGKEDLQVQSLKKRPRTEELNGALLIAHGLLGECEWFRDGPQASWDDLARSNSQLNILRVSSNPGSISDVSAKPPHNLAKMALPHGFLTWGLVKSLLVERQAGVPMVDALARHLADVAPVVGLYLLHSANAVGEFPDLAKRLQAEAKVVARSYGKKVDHIGYGKEGEREALQQTLLAAFRQP